MTGLGERTVPVVVNRDRDLDREDHYVDACSHSDLLMVRRNACTLTVYNSRYLVHRLRTLVSGSLSVLSAGTCCTAYDVMSANDAF